MLVEEKSKTDSLLLEAHTTRFGKIEYRSSQVIEMTQGLPGFDSLRKYLLVTRPEFEPFTWLQSLERPEIAFVLLDPMILLDDYRIELPETEIAALGINNFDNAGAYVIVTVPSGRPTEITANLLGPVIINFENRKARQVVLSQPEYSTRHRVFGSLEKYMLAMERGDPIIKVKRHPSISIE